MNFPTGCLIDPAQTEETRKALGPCSAYEVTPSIQGRWMRAVQAGVTKILLWEAEEKLTGKIADPDYQERGTCASRGAYKALLRSYYYDLAQGSIIGQPKRPSFEVIYALGRNNARKLAGKQPMRSHAGSCRCGHCGDGAFCSDIARGLCEIGELPAGTYGGHRLDGTNENGAIDLANSGIGQDLLSLPDWRKCRVMECRNSKETADTIASGHGVNRGSQHFVNSGASWGTDGVCEMTYHNGGHAEAVTGVWLVDAVSDTTDLDEIMSKTRFGTEGSWGKNAFRGPRTVKAAGGTVTIPPGSYPTDARNIDRALSSGEAWAADLVESWR